MKQEIGIECLRENSSAEDGNCVDRRTQVHFNELTRLKISVVVGCDEEEKTITQRVTQKVPRAGE